MRQLDEELAIGLVDLHRKEDCEHYDDCLEEASCQGWKSFSCHGCKKYEAGEVKYDDPIAED